VTLATDLELVLLPGLDGTGQLFAPLLKELPAGLRVTVIDYPPQEPLTYAQLAAQVGKRLPPDRPLVLCAESFSGPIAVQMVHSGMPNVKGVILCATFARSPHPLLHLARRLPLSILFRLPVPRLLVRQLFLGRAAPESLVRLFQQSLSAVSPATLAARVRQVASVDMGPSLEAVKVPCCYIRASSDALVPHQCLKPFQKGIPHLVVKEVEGSHLIL
jgi:pimeloyl-ACP methyl ester carboxylesterase